MHPSVANRKREREKREREKREREKEESRQRGKRQREKYTLAIVGSSTTMQLRVAFHFCRIIYN